VLQDKLSPLEEKARQANSFSADLEVKSAALEDSQKKLKDCEETAASQKTQYESQIEELEKQLEIAKQAKAEITAQLDEAKDKNEKDSASITNLELQLKTATEKIQTLENDLAAKGASQTEAEEIYKKNKASLEEQIDSLNKQVAELQQKIPEERLAAAEEEKRKCDEQIVQKQNEINALQEQLESAKQETQQVKANRQRNLADLSTTEAAKLTSKEAEITELQARLNTLTQELESVKMERAATLAQLTEFQAQKAANISAKDAIISSLENEIDLKDETIDDLENQLSTRPTKEAVNSLTEASGNKDKQIAQLELQHELNSQKISELEKSLAAAEAILPGIQADKDKTTSDLTNQLLEARAALDAKRKELTEEKIKLEAEITELQAQKAELEKQLVGRDEIISAKNAEIDQLKSQLSSLRAEKRKSNENVSTEKAALENEVQRLKSEITTKEAELQAAEKEKEESIKTIGELEAKIATLTAEVSTKDAEHKTEIAELSEKVSNLENQVSEANIKLKDTNTANNLAVAKSRIIELENQITSLTSQLDTTLETEKEQTKKRLDNLLSRVLIDQSLTEKAHQYLAGEIEDLAAFENELKDELCQFFKYLVGLINLQLNKIKSSKLPPEAKKDIFSIFDKIPAVINSNSLTVEISEIFQELFVSVGKTNKIPRALELTNEYPILYSILSNFSLDKSGNPLKEKRPAWATGLMTELGSMSYMMNTGIQPSEEENRFILRPSKTPDEFQKNNTEHFVPLTVLAIKFIQLLGDTLTGKYKNLAERCGIPIEPIAGFAKINTSEPPRIQPEVTNENENEEWEENLTPRAQFKKAEEKAKAAVDALRKRGSQYTKSSILGDITRYVDLVGKGAKSKPMSTYDDNYNKVHLIELMKLYEERKEKDPRTYPDFPRELKRKADEALENIET
jgi:predicted  nucleic acid-binding Zn-ribbon protein